MLNYLKPIQSIKIFKFNTLMHKIQITFVPTPEPTGEIIPMAFSTRTDSWEYIVATRENNQFLYEHKVVLSNNGTVLQVLSADEAGQITEALAEDAFDIATQSVTLTLIDTYDDGTEYKLRIETAPITAPGSTTVLSGLYNPQLRIAEVSYLQDENQIHELEFIGAEDIRMGFAARVIRRPGEAFEIIHDDGDIVFSY